MTSENKGSGALQAEPLDAGPEQGGSNMGGLGATGAVDRERDPDAEGYSRPKSRPASMRLSKRIMRQAASRPDTRKRSAGNTRRFHIPTSPALSAVDVDITDVAAIVDVAAE